MRAAAQKPRALRARPLKKTRALRARKGLSKKSDPPLAGPDRAWSRAQTRRPQSMHTAVGVACARAACAGQWAKKEADR